MKEYIKQFCWEFDYPKEAEQALLDAYDSIMANKKSAELFNGYVKQYEENILDKIGDAMDELNKEAESIGVHTFTMMFVFLMCLSKHLRKIYMDKNISYDIYFDSMYDFRCKLFECYNMYGIWGTFVGFWYPGFFNLKLFGLGRLEFELCESQISYESEGVNIKPGDLVIGVHIPSRGPLNMEDCKNSFKRAAEFFADKFIGNKIVFTCGSWLLFPEHKEFLPKTSNILKFMELFDIINGGPSNDNADAWRIFNKGFDGNTTEGLPTNTSLQRAYIDWFNKGNTMGYGTGVRVEPNLKNS